MGWFGGIQNQPRQEPCEEKAGFASDCNLRGRIDTEVVKVDRKDPNSALAEPCKGVKMDPE